MPRTLTAMFADRAAAEKARDRLIDAGVAASEIDIRDEGGEGLFAEPARVHDSGHGFLAELKSFFSGHEDHHAYAEGLTRGHVLITATVDDAVTDRAIAVLEASDAVDLDRSEAQWREAGWTGAPSAESTGAAHVDASVPARADNAGEVIEVAEERLVVGKREIERGGVRVRSYIVEQPVSEQVTLREERVDVERRPVNRPLAAGDDAFQERTIEMRETAEEPVVGKEAVVTEEIGIRKDVGQRTQEVHDTVRRTQVDVERTDDQHSSTQDQRQRSA